MSVHGHLFCKDCKERIFLGKWLRSDGLGFGFWHGSLCPEGVADSLALGRKALRFLARHLNHELIAGSDTGGLSDELSEQGYLVVDDEYDAMAVLEEVPSAFLSPPPARLLGNSQATQWRNPKFRPGDRVVMLRHGGWNHDAIGTIAEPGEPYELSDGSIELHYWLKFDEPQRHFEQENVAGPTSDEALAPERLLRRREGAGNGF